MFTFSIDSADDHLPVSASMNMCASICSPLMGPSVKGYRICLNRWFLATISSDTTVNAPSDHSAISRAHGVMCLGISLSYFFTSTTVISIGIIRPNCSDGTLPPQWGHTTTATRRTCEWMGGKVSRVRIKLIKLQFIRSLLGWLLLAVVLRVLLLVLTLDDHGWILGRLIFGLV